jgi:hypothetical protein
MERLRSLQQVQTVLKVMKQHDAAAHAIPGCSTLKSERQLAETLICLASNFGSEFVERVHQLQAWVPQPSVLEDISAAVNNSNKAGKILPLRTQRTRSDCFLLPFAETLQIASHKEGVCSFLFPHHIAPPHWIMQEGGRQDVCRRNS